MTSLGGNFGHSVSKISPKNFTLTPVDQLKPMSFELNSLPRDIPISCDKKELDVDKVRQKLRRQRFDHLNYDPYVQTHEGQALYKGVLADEGQKQEDDKDEPKDLYAYLISKGLTKRKKRKRGDPIDMFVSRRDLQTRNNNISTQGPTPKKLETFNKYKELAHIYDMTEVDAPPMAVINSRINEYFERQNTKEYLKSFLHYRRGIEAKLDEGYKIVRHEPKEIDEQLR